MKFFCNSCELDRDFDLDYGMMVITDKKGVTRICRLCRRPKAGMPDVFWNGTPEENLADDPMTGKPRVFASKGEKATYLKERNLIEAGDRYHGAPATTQPPPKVDTRDQVRQALAKVKQMGRDVRRQAYLRIIKEGRRYA